MVLFADPRAEKPTSVVTLASKVAAPEFTPASRAKKCENIEHFVTVK